VETIHLHLEIIHLSVGREHAPFRLVELQAMCAA
jgi:hypothetical protein